MTTVDAESFLAVLTFLTMSQNTKEIKINKCMMQLNELQFGV